jgi:adenine-specific DNA glycosylase
MEKGWIIPDKKFGLVQEDFLDDPWKVLMCCIMLNLTSHKQVRPMVHQFFKRFSSPSEIIKADASEIISFIRSLGMYNRRTSVMKKFSEAYLSFNLADDPKKLPGIGEYASDAFNILINNDYSIQPNDGPLTQYVTWYHENYVN